MEINKLLVLSLAHASPSARSWLSEAATENHARLYHGVGDGAAISSVAAAAFGYFTRVPEDPEGLGVCDDLLPLLSFVRAYGADYLLLDADACSHPSLPTWDDEGEYVPAEEETTAAGIGRVIEAARAVVTQFDSTHWRETEPAALAVNTLRGALADYEAEPWRADLERELDRAAAEPAGGPEAGDVDEDPQASWRATAEVEGWGFFESNGDEAEQIHLCRDDEAKKFETDADAWVHVWIKARAGSIPHKDALNFLQEESPIEYADLVSYCSE